MCADTDRIHPVDHVGRALPGARAAERAALAAGPPAAGAGRLVRGRQGLRRPVRRGGVHRAADAGRRRRRSTPTSRPRPPAHGRDPDAGRRSCPASCRCIGATEAEARGAGARAGRADRARVRAAPARPSMLGVDLTEPAARRAAARRCPTRGRDRGRQEPATRWSSTWPGGSGLTVRQLIARLGGGRGHRSFAGTPEQVADTIEEWFTRRRRRRLQHHAAAAARRAGATSSTRWCRCCSERGLFRTEYTGPHAARALRPAAPGQLVRRDRRW